MGAFWRVFVNGLRIDCQMENSIRCEFWVAGKKLILPQNVKNAHQNFIYLFGVQSIEYIVYGFAVGELISLNSREFGNRSFAAFTLPSFLMKRVLRSHAEEHGCQSSLKKRCKGVGGSCFSRISY